MRVSPVELNIGQDVTLHNFASTEMSSSRLQLCHEASSLATQKKRTSLRLTLSASGPGTFPKANKALLRNGLKLSSKVISQSVASQQVFTVSHNVSKPAV